MASENETIADIVAEMLEFAETDSQTIDRDVLRRRIQNFARRIEAAAKREREATPEKSSVVANAMKMREALSGLLEIVCIDCKSPYEIDGKCVKCPRVVAAEAALATPPRNCDVGTPDEQDARHSKWCRKYGIDGDMEVACAHQDMSCTLCALRWSQMPYEEGGEK